MYVNPFGLLYSEVTAGSLVKVNLDGEVIDGGSTKLGINRPAFLIHSAIHRARPDIRCVLHMHTAVVGAVSFYQKLLFAKLWISVIWVPWLWIFYHVRDFTCKNYRQ